MFKCELKRSKRFYVGGASEAEIGEKRERVIDAVLKEHSYLPSLSGSLKTI